MLKEEDDAHALATNMDIGTAYVDLKRRKVHYSGAKIALYYCDGEDVHEVKAARRAIGDKRVGEYHNTSIDLRSGRTFYMTTDGFLDGPAATGYGFGNSRFASMIREHARRPLAEQGRSLQPRTGALPGRISAARRHHDVMFPFRLRQGVGHGPIDMFAMRECYNQQQIMLLCFNGPISRSLIEEIGNALRNYMTEEQAHPSSAMDVFAVYIEMTQNIRHYTREKNWSDQQAGATVVVSRDDGAAMSSRQAISSKPPTVRYCSTLSRNWRRKTKPN